MSTVGCESSSMMAPSQLGTPLELFGFNRDIRVARSIDLDGLLLDAIEKELIEEMGL